MVALFCSQIDIAELPAMTPSQLAPPKRTDHRHVRALALFPDRLGRASRMAANDVLSRNSGVAGSPGAGARQEPGFRLMSLRCAKSKVGAIGISAVAPSYATE